MEINRRPLYNSLRMNWVRDPSMQVEAWQVEDYRSLPLDMLFEKLSDKGINLDKTTFQAFAENVDSPEDFVDSVLDDIVQDVMIRDQVYLVVFELWRRLLPERPCLSIFCDEIDHQIHLYDQNQIQNIEAIQDALANLQMILDENTDKGVDFLEVFEYVNAGCAHNLEDFLIDFMLDQIDSGNPSYASDLLEGFGKYIRDVKWVKILQALLYAENEPKEAMAIVQGLMSDKKALADLEFNLELLSLLVRIGDKETFERLARRTADLIQREDDFQVLLSLCADFYHRIDCDDLENKLQSILDRRNAVVEDNILSRKEKDFLEFTTLITSKR